MTTLTVGLLLLLSALGHPSIRLVADALPRVTGAAAQVQAGRGQAAQVFAIYLLAEPVDRRVIGYGRGEWSQLRLADSPLISANDIIDYDWSKHSMRVLPDALTRIPRPPVEGVPFVVVAGGQRIYMGVLVTAISSFSFAVPSITVDRRILDPAQPRDTIVIDRAYPASSFGAGPDARADERIKTALSALRKLKSARYRPIA